jgi:hypothetical protein
MYVPFSQLKPESRIWIYQSDRLFTAKEIDLIQRHLESYCERWMAHGSPLRASFDLRYDRFIIVAVDESVTQTSGCSIDDSVRAIKEIEDLTNVSLFDRNLIPFFINESVITLALNELKLKYQQGAWNESTLVFDNLIQSKGALETVWLKPAGQTWLKRYLKPVAA